MISTRGDDQPNQNDQEDDIIGEEVRPLPIDGTMDIRMQALHALLQDHTYVQMPKKVSTITTATSVTVSTSGVIASTPSSTLVSTASVSTVPSPVSKLQSPSKALDSSHTQSILSSPSKDFVGNAMVNRTKVSIVNATAVSSVTNSISSVAPMPNIAKSGPTLNIPFSYDVPSNGKCFSLFSFSFSLFVFDLSVRGIGTSH